MILRTKRTFSLFLACIFMLSILGNVAEAAVATLLSPKPNDSLGKFVDVSVKYDSQSKVLIDSATLYVDNTVYETKKLNPAKQGVVSFEWNTGNYRNGQHYLKVILFAKGKKVTEVMGYGIVSDTVDDVVPPKVSISNIKDNESISGIKVIEINAKDDSGEAPIVSLLIDKKLKLMQNTNPYTYALNTADLTNGKHVIEVYAFDFEGNQSDIVSYTVNVNNEIGAAVGNEVKNYVPADTAVMKTPALSTRPSVTATDEKAVGRISDSEVTASLSSVKSSAVNDKKTVSPIINSETTKIVLKDPAVNTNVASASAVKSNDIKLVLPETRLSEYSLNVPKIKNDPVMVAKKINDSVLVDNEVKILSGSLDTPKTSIASAPVKTNALVDSAVSGKSAVTGPMLKADVNSAKVSYNVNTPKIAEAKPVLKAEAKPVKETVKAEVKTNVKTSVPAKGKVKLRDVVKNENGTLFWNNKTKTVTAYVNNVKVELKIGSKKAKVNDKSVSINLVPQLVKGRTIIDITEFKKIIDVPALKD